MDLPHTIPRRIFNALVACAATVVASHASAVSFDCGRARSDVEKLVCSDPTLGALDDKLSSAYTALMSRLSAQGKRALATDERRWASSRKVASGGFPRVGVESLRHSYRERIEFIASLDQGDNLLLVPGRNRDGDTYRQIDTTDPFLQEINRLARPPSKEETVSDPEILEQHWESEILALSADLLVIRYKEWELQEGAAHSNGGNSYAYFSRTARRALSWADIFRNARSEELTRLFVAHIGASVDVATAEQQVRDALASVDLPGSTVLDEDGIFIDIGCSGDSRCLYFAGYGDDTHEGRPTSASFAELSPFLTDKFRAEVAAIEKRAAEKALTRRARQRL